MTAKEWEEDFDNITDKIMELGSFCSYLTDVNITCINCPLHRKCKIIRALVEVARLEYI